MTVSVSVRHDFPGFTLDATFDAPSGVVALYGPSGSGKTTIVNAIAGILRPAVGRVIIGGVTLLDTASGIVLPPHRRATGYVFQDGRLMPHLSVRQNLLYGRWFGQRDGRDTSPGFDETVALLALEPLLARRPAMLSGGEKQRVAIGRALLSNPRILLLDEPFAAIDAGRRLAVMPYLERLRDRLSIPMLYVSHSQDEIARLSTTAVRLANGKVMACGSTADVLNDVAMPGLGQEPGALVTASAERFDGRYGLTELRSAAGLWRLPISELATGQTVRLWVRARDVTLAIAKPSGLSALNVFAGTVIAVQPATGQMSSVVIDCNGTMLKSLVTNFSLSELDIRPGRAVSAIVKAAALAGDDRA